MRSRVIQTIALLLGIHLACFSTSVDGQDDTQPTDAPDQAVANDPKGPTAPTELPTRMPDGRGIWALKVYEGQLVDMIPKNYRPLVIKRLANAIRETVQAQSVEQDVRLRSAFYDVRLDGESLVCQRMQSELTLEVPRDGEAAIDLGPCNLSLQSSPTLMPRLECDGYGHALAVVSRDVSRSDLCNVKFSWSKRGKPNGFRTDFDLVLPRAAQAKMVLSVPPDFTIETSDGVLRSPGSPPFGAEPRSQQVRWYEIEIGGLSRLRLTAVRNAESQDAERIVVTDSTLRYQVAPSGIRWIQQMNVKLLGGNRLPPFLVMGGEVASVTIDQVGTEFQSSKTDDGFERVVISEVIGSSKSDLATVLVTVSGNARMKDNEWVDLPSFYWQDFEVLRSDVIESARISIDPRLQIVNWDLPDQWKQSTEDQQGLFAQGPPNKNVIDPSDEPAEQIAWSRAKFARLSDRATASCFIEYKISDETRGALSSISARGRITIPVSPSRIDPLRIQIESSWGIQSISILGSQRDIRVPPGNGDRTFTVWPESGDIRDGNLVINVVAERTILTGNIRTRIPPLWMIRPLDLAYRTYALLVPPEQLNWASDTSLKPDQITTDDWDEDVSEYFGEMPSEALLFAPRFGQLPELELQPPDISYDVQTSLKITRDANEVTEVLSIETRSSTQRIRDIVTVEVGPGDPLPQYRWSLHDSSENTLPLNLPERAIEYTPETGLYRVSIGSRNLRGKRLVGQRQYSITARPETISLPVIPDSSSQVAEVLLGPGFAFRGSTGSVDLVPAEQDSSETEGRFTRLRYDSGGNPRIRLDTTTEQSSLTIVWQQDVNVIASSRGGDTINAVMRVSSSKPIQIDCDADLRLVSLSHNNRPLSIDGISQQPITLPPRDGINIIRVVWTRNAARQDWMRKCRIPEVKVRGVSVNSTWRLTAAHDTFAPRSLLEPTNEASAEGQILSVVSSGSVVLIHRNFAMALGWLVALLVFATSWFVARKSLAAVFAGVALTATLAVMWWPWQVAILGWAIIPAISAAMLVVTRNWKTSQTYNESQVSQVSDSEEGFDFSYTALGVLFLVAVPFASQGQAQRPNASSNRETPPIQVLVPTDDQGQPVGDKVYVPNAVFEELFGKQSDELVASARIRKADYALKIPSSLASQPEFIVSLTIQVPAERSGKILLPYQQRTVRRVELRQGEQRRILNSEASSDGTTLVSIPPGEQFELQLTLLPIVQQTGSRMRLSLDIPPIQLATASIEAELGVRDLRIRNRQGKREAQEALRQWQIDLGPERQFLVDYRVDDIDSASANAPVIQNYWIRVGLSETTVEGEVNVSETLSPGDVVELEFSGATPELISTGWHLKATSAIALGREILTIEKQSDDDQPIRLLWSMATTVNDPTSTDDSIPMTIPFIFQTQSNDTKPASYAIQYAQGLQVNEAGNLQGLEIEQFVSEWLGDGAFGNINRCFSVSQDAPSLTILQANAVASSCKQTQRLHLSTDRMELDFSATIIDNNEGVTRRTLALPNGLQVLSLQVNGEERSIDILESNQRRELLLGPGIQQVNMTGFMDLGRNKQRLAPPQVRVWPPIATESDYQVSREPDTRVTVLNLGSAITTLDPKLDVDDLRDLRLPVVRWKRSILISESYDANTEIELNIRTTRRSFDCSQVIGLGYLDGIWKLTVELELNPDDVPATVDLQIPRRWTQALSLPASVFWVQADSLDPNLSIIRIATASIPGNRILIQSELESSDQGGIQVPQVIVLGTGNRRISISVPANQWKRSGVQPDSLDEETRKRLALNTNQQEYTVDRPRWSMELVPKPDVKTNVLSKDIQVFLQEQEALVLCRWDLVPGTLSTVGIQLPPDGTCLGAWSASQAVEIEFLEQDDPGTDSFSQTAVVPLSLSKLSQPIEVLLSVPIQTAKTDAYLPKLVSIKSQNSTEVLVSEQTWLAIYRPNADSGSANRIGLTASDLNFNQQARAHQLAGSVLKSIESSLETLAELPKAEAAAWFLPWAQHYESIADSVGHQVVWKLADEDETDKNVATLGKWQDLDQRMRIFAQRFVNGTVPNGIPLFAGSRFSGYAMASARSLRPDEIPEPIQGVSVEMRTLRSLIRRVLTLFMVCGLLIVLWPFRRHTEWIVYHPAVWLGLLGICVAVVSSMQMGGAIILLAFTATMSGRIRQMRLRIFSRGVARGR